LLYLLRLLLLFDSFWLLRYVDFFVRYVDPFRCCDCVVTPDDYVTIYALLLIAVTHVVHVTVVVDCCSRCGCCCYVVVRSRWFTFPFVTLLTLLLRFALIYPTLLLLLLLYVVRLRCCYVDCCFDWLLPCYLSLPNCSLLLLLLLRCYVVTVFDRYLLTVDCCYSLIRYVHYIVVDCCCCYSVVVVDIVVVVDCCCCCCCAGVVIVAQLLLLLLRCLLLLIVDVHCYWNSFVDLLLLLIVNCYNCCCCYCIVIVVVIVVIVIIYC